MSRFTMCGYSMVTKDASEKEWASRVICMILNSFTKQQTQNKYNKGDTPCVANPGAQFCQQGTVKISGLGLYQGTSQTTCSDVANTIETIWSNCQTDSLGQPALTGGSAATSENPNLIVHMQPY